MIYIGIDPGESGGIAWIDNGETTAVKMPETERDVWDVLCQFQSNDSCAVLEFVQAMPAHLRGRSQGLSSTFKFGVGYGNLRMALIAAGVPFVTVPPSKWQREMGCLTKGDKKVSKARAQELHPELKVTLATADAILLAEYCRRHYGSPS